LLPGAGWGVAGLGRGGPAEPEGRRELTEPNLTVSPVEPSNRLVGAYDMPLLVTGTDYKTDVVSVENLLSEVRKRTTIPVTVTTRELPLNAEANQESPIIFLTGHRALKFDEKERAALRKYVDDGGTIYAEDCHGPFAQTVSVEIRRIFGGKPLRDIPLSDPIYQGQYKLDAVPPGDMQERYPLQGIQRPDGSWAVIFSRNDYSDAWKAAQESYVQQPAKEAAYKMGVNIYVYAVSRWRQRTGQAGAGPALGR
jgi:hypothetical protein